MYHAPLSCYHLDSYILAPRNIMGVSLTETLRVEIG